MRTPALFLPRSLVQYYAHRLCKSTHMGRAAIKMVQCNAGGIWSSAGRQEVFARCWASRRAGFSVAYILLDKQPRRRFSPIASLGMSAFLQSGHSHLVRPMSALRQKRTFVPGNPTYNCQVDRASSSAMKPSMFWLRIACSMAVLFGLVAFALSSSRAIHSGRCPPASPHCSDKRALPAHS